MIHIQRTLKYIEDRGYSEDTPNPRASKRDIPLTADLVALLDEQRNYWDFKVERLDRYPFCNEKGEPLGRGRLQTDTFATWAIEAGMPPQVLKTILGHSFLAMTMDLYSHVLPDTKAAEMEKITGVF